MDRQRRFDSKGLWLTSDQNRSVAADFMVVIIFHSILFTEISELWDDPDRTLALGPSQEDPDLLWAPHGTLYSA